MVCFPKWAFWFIVCSLSLSLVSGGYCLFKSEAPRACYQNTN